MKNLITISVLAGFVMLPLSVLWAQDRDESADQQKVEQRLEKEYNVTDAQIDNLRKQGLGYGEIRHTLSLAQQMPGGINDNNIHQVVDLRQGNAHPQGWGRVDEDVNAAHGGQGFQAGHGHGK